MPRSAPQAPLLPETAAEPPATGSGVAGLVEAVLAGDSRAAERLYAGVRPRLLRIALALGVDPDSAADLVQETLWSAHRNLRRYQPADASFEGWLAVILVRRARNWRRSARRRTRLLDALRRQRPSAAPRGHEVLEARLTVRRLLAELTRRQREVVALYDIGELEATQVARALELSPAGVRSIARDARRRLTDAVRAPGETP